MKRILVIAAVAASLNALAGVGATTNWVAKYVREYVGNAISNSLAEVMANTTTTTTNRTTTIVAGTEEYSLVATVEIADIAALKAGEVSSAATEEWGVTSNTKWVMTGTNVFSNASGYPITVTPTNFLYRGVMSVAVGGDYQAFPLGGGFGFRLEPVTVTESEARMIIGE